MYLRLATALCICSGKPLSRFLFRRPWPSLPVPITTQDGYYSRWILSKTYGREYVLDRYGREYLFKTYSRPYLFIHIVPVSYCSERVLSNTYSLPHPSRSVHKCPSRFLFRRPVLPFPIIVQMGILLLHIRPDLFVNVLPIFCSDVLSSPFPLPIIVQNGYSLKRILLHIHPEATTFVFCSNVLSFSFPFPIICWEW